MASAVSSPERRRYRAAIYTFATFTELEFHRGVCNHIFIFDRLTTVNYLIFVIYTLAIKADQLKI